MWPFVFALDVNALNFSMLLSGCSDYTNNWVFLAKTSTNYFHYRRSHILVNMSIYSRCFRMYNQLWKQAYVSTSNWLRYFSSVFRGFRLFPFSSWLIRVAVSSSICPTFNYPVYHFTWREYKMSGYN